MAVEEPPAEAIGPAQLRAVEHRQTRDLLARLLDELDDDKRAVFVLYEVEGLLMKQVAEVVGCPLQTAYSRLHAARELLAAAYLRATSEAGSST